MRCFNLIVVPQCFPVFEELAFLFEGHLTFITCVGLDTCVNSQMVEQIAQFIKLFFTVSDAAYMNGVQPMCCRVDEFSGVKHTI